MKSKHDAKVVVWLSAAVLGLAMGACGAPEVTGSAVTGVALTDGPISGTVSLTDSSADMQSRSVSTRADGSFSIDVAGLTPPYMLRVLWTDADGDKRLFAVSEGNANLDVNPITDIGFSASSESGDDDGVFEHSGSDQKRDAATRARLLLARLSTVLAPLFQRYGITDPMVDKEAVRVLLLDVRVSRDDGRVTVRNRLTGGVIFTGRLTNLEAGTFYPENMPAGPGTPPPPATCASFTYSAYGACQPDNTQTRTVLTSLPAGCTGGSPVTTQACTYVPPVNTCTSFTYSAYGACQPDNTQTRTVLTSLPAGCTGGSPVTTQACTYVPPVITCTSFTYSAYGACQPNNTQTRTVLTSSPTGCTGGSPVTTQACTYVPPVVTCTSFTYSAYGACQPNNTQTRTVLTSSPAGCTGGSPVTTQACTYVPPVITCTSFTYSAYGACQPDNTQTRTVLTSSPSGCTGGSPVTTQACTYVPPVITCTSFTYSAWAACQPNNTQTRTVLTSSPSGCTGGSPVTTQACTYVPPVCTSFTYSAWGACQPSNTQTRNVLTSSPSGCAGGSPVTLQACTYVPPIDGAALYAQYCSGCHGNGKKGSSASAIQSAINSNRGGMGSLSFLTPEQIAAISAAP